MESQSRRPERSSSPYPGGRAMTVDIDVPLVRRLLAAQFPAWAHLPLAKVEPGGWDNRTFRLGDNMSVRLPSAAAYSGQVPKEHRWLRLLAAQLPLPIPEPLALGEPGEGYPWRWSVYRWLEGETAAASMIHDSAEFARSLADFLIALQRVDPTDGPPPGQHNFWRGGPPSTYDDETRRAIRVHRDQLEADLATAIWDEALAATWRGPPVWLHGDVNPTNLLVRHGRLSAVIDFGCCAVGDPAGDLTVAWSLLGSVGRATFREAMPADEAAWARARGWALWKALITLERQPEGDPAKAVEARRILDELFAEVQGRQRVSSRSKARS